MSVARSELRLPTNTAVVLPEYLEDIVDGSHASLGDTGRQLLRELLHRYEHVFPAPGEPVTARSKSVQHEIVTQDRYVVDHADWHRPVSERNRNVLRTCYPEDRLNPVTAPGPPQWC